ncbi:Tps3 regulatory subunit of trehalose-phosphate synthase [Candida orthopsilosis Co 90-125]|uniref:Tps3 regulatory subunit of trehalose-phosphate synthase n=1 Tax=Candida orthopsilosis (strain 90-125) TaxID=1136231 RepID=H8X4C8_CANO9|nr:Tps3 regulatory subunit of trehalose-phosphate synthase [Candida orthopsilosis Co 90-125]CCG26080.1 Tps3 regulatory subunit of trehalose-phosphate synthase [Candida orthopsilosis Co 90-125]
MTIIVGSLFLPYTVHFEIDRNHYEFLQKEDSAKLETIRISGGQDDNTIPPSLTASQPHLLNNSSSVSILHPNNVTNSSTRSETPDEFFYNKRNPRSQREGVPDSYPASPALHYIQPKPRVGNKIESSILDPKKQTDPYNSTGLKINRSSTNLSISTPNLSRPQNIRAGSHSKLHNEVTLGSRPHQYCGFTIQGNNSLNSLVSEETPSGVNNSAMIPSSFEDEDEDGLIGFEKNYNNSVSHNRGLAPYGGFSKPHIEKYFWDDDIFNIAPWSVVPSESGNGSLNKAIDLSVKEGILQQNKWVGIIAMPSDTISEKIRQDIASKLDSEYNCEAVFPDDITFEGHYKSFCKQILWPTLHYQIPDDPKSKAFEDHSWGHYVLMNQLVADKLVETFVATNGDCNFDDSENVIWVHDYHLLLVPRMVREKLPKVKIGFFLHVSFPSSEVFRCLAQRTELLEGMLGADVISFQTNEYVRHFKQTCNKILKAEVTDDKVAYKNRTTIVNTIPVGIDAPSLEKKIHSDSVLEWRRLIRERWGEQKLIISRDKLDKLRGIKQKLLAYEKFLNQHPEYIDKTVLIQICIGSGSDPSYESEVMKIISRINSLPENISVIQPVVLLQKDIEFDQYLALQCEAESFVVSSMREGLNLTCHEFITATEEKKSPLILSEFTGSASLLYCEGEGALLINPWDLKKFSEAFYESLIMSKEEKKKRWENCHHFVLTQNSKHWVTNCLESINNAWSLIKEESRK